MASKTMFVVICLVAILIDKNSVVDAVIGVNWGRQSAQRLIPSTVVDLLLQNGVKEARIYTSQDDLLQAFAGSGIGLSLSATDPSVLGDADQCVNWVIQKMPYFNVSSVRRVYVGSAPFTMGIKDKATLQKTMEAQVHLQDALNNARWEGIKAIISHSASELKDNITKPSEAEFRDEIKDQVVANLQFMARNNAPFVIDMVPSLQTEAYHLDPLFSFVGQSKQVIRDTNGAIYTHIFEFMYDSFVSALAKLNVTDINIIVGQVGWPTDGYQRGNASTAERFFKGLLPYVMSNKGTPLRPGAPIDTFVHALTDENKLPNKFMRHWGIYRSNGKPKFKIDLSGQGRDIYPTSAKGIMRMPERWCVFNGNRTDYQKVMNLYNLACNKSDCSSLVSGGKCSNLSFNAQISFAFNMYFQFQFQNEKACFFEGLSSITAEDPSTYDCEFPVEVVRGNQDNYVSPQEIEAHMKTNSKGIHHKPSCVVSLFLLSILCTLFWN